MASPLLVRPGPPDAEGAELRVTPQSAGWSHVGFALHRLAPGTVAKGGEAGREACLVLVSGAGRVTVDGAELGTVGGRTSPFEDAAPGAVYVPPGVQWRVTAEGACAVELAVCTAPGQPGRAARVIKADSMRRSTRGRGSNTRHVRDILPETEPADGLLVVEVITPAGNASSYPPHKHDTAVAGEETVLEETYYHRIDPPQGFAFQRVYSDDRSLDEAIVAHDGDIVLVPRGYHPVVVPHGYDLYYLNVMAGPVRRWLFRNDPDHAWILGSPAENPVASS